ncbi:hypothetical protein ShzoTeo12_53560 (plasmid) [Shinella zoogloeoides]|nr:hypothetical protein ShzoTeo12_53560 [Shinella zoogloeoides]
MVWAMRLRDRWWYCSDRIEEAKERQSAKTLQ